MINTYLSVQKEWIAGLGFNNSFTLTLTNAGSAFDTSAYTFVVNIRRIGSDTNLLQLTQGAGITNGGSNGIVTIQLTAAQTTTLGAGTYYYAINYTVSSLPYGLLCGTFELRNQYNPENENNSISVPVSLAGTDVNVAVTLGSNISAPRVYQTTSTATLTLNVDSYDAADVTAQAEAIVISNPTGTPTNLREINYRIADDGTAQAITFDTQFEALANSDLPATTIVGEALLFTARWNSDTSKWQVQNAGSGSAYSPDQNESIASGIWTIATQWIFTTAAKMAGIITPDMPEYYDADAGDGVTDASVAFNAALTALGDYAVINGMPGSTYLFKGEVRILPKSPSFFGYGCRIHRDDEVVTTTTAAVASGSTTINATDASIYSIGESLILLDVTSPNGGVADGEESNPVTITNIVANVITVDTPISLPDNGNLASEYPIGTKILKVYNLFTGNVGANLEFPTIFEGWTIDGNADNNTSFRGWIHNGTYRNISAGSVVSKNTFLNIPNENLFPSSNCRLHNNYAETLYGSFCHISKNSNDLGETVIANNILKSVCLTPESIGGHNEGVITLSAQANKTIIQGNQVSDSNGMLVAPMVADSTGIHNYLIISGNKCENLLGIIRGESDPVNSDPAYPIEGVVIIGNIFKNCDYLSLIGDAVDGTITVGGGFDNVNITGNMFTNTRFRFESCSNLIFNNNLVVFEDGFIAVDTSIPITTNYTNAISMDLCVSVKIKDNIIHNKALTQDATLTRGLILNIGATSSDLLIKTSAVVQTRYLYGLRNFNVSGNSINGFGTGFHVFGSSFGNSKGLYSALGCRISNNIITLRKDNAVQAAEVTPGIVFENNTLIGDSSATRGVQVHGVNVTYDATLNGGICRFNTIIGFNESIEIVPNAGTSVHNAIVEYNLYDGTIDDNSGGNSVVANNTAIVNETIPIFEPRENPSFY